MGKPRYTVTLEVNAHPDNIQVVLDGLSAYNRSQIVRDAGDNMKSLTLFVRDNNGMILGGLLGTTFWDWLHVSILWLHEDLRGQDLGSDLLGMAEAEALKRGCHSAFVDTMSFQALPFYEKLGYTVYGQLEDFPTGHSRYFLKKRFSNHS
jgi:GNAT superfamily N-acetyltransferase